MSDQMDIERAGYPGPDGPAPLSPCNHRFVFGQSACQECGVDFPLTLPDLPLSPIALDKAELRRFFGIAWEGGRNEGGPAAINNRLLVEQDFECALRALDAQLSAIVARVAQGEREKYEGDLRLAKRLAVMGQMELGHIPDPRFGDLKASIIDLQKTQTEFKAVGRPLTDQQVDEAYTLLRGTP